MHRVGLSFGLFCGMAALAFSGCPSGISPRETVHREFFRLSKRMFHYLDQEKLPPRRLDALMKEWKREFERTGERPFCPDPTWCPLLRSGRDPWGSPFFWRLYPNPGFAVIRSAGPNRKDENGLGDDIVRNIPLTTETWTWMSGTSERVREGRSRSPDVLAEWERTKGEPRNVRLAPPFRGRGERTKGQKDP